MTSDFVKLGGTGTFSYLNSGDPNFMIFTAVCRGFAVLLAYVIGLGF